MTATVYDVARARHLTALDGRLTSLEDRLREAEQRLADLNVYATWLREDIDAWRKSSYSANNGLCVEVCTVDATQVLVRDSKNPAGPVLSFEPAEWRAFTACIKRGQS